MKFEVSMILPLGSGHIAGIDMFYACWLSKEHTGR